MRKVRREEGAKGIDGEERGREGEEVSTREGVEGKGTVGREENCKCTIIGTY